MALIQSNVTEDMFVVEKTAENDVDSDEEEDYYFSDVD